MPSTFDIAAMEDSSRNQFRDKYPKFRKQYIEEHRFESKSGEPSKHSTDRRIQSFHFLQEDEKQLVQLRTQGFSFNRLAPYSSLDDYLPEIERIWRLWVDIVSPVQIRAIRLRYINRILLPLKPEGIELSEFFKTYPTLPDENLILSGFLNQYHAIEKSTGFQVNVVFTGQPQENDKAPFIFDNTSIWTGTAKTEDWDWILQQIMSLRGLKNRVFENTLTKKCLQLFQQL